MITSKAVKIDWSHTYVQENAPHAPIGVYGWFFDSSDSKELMPGRLVHVCSGFAHEYSFIANDVIPWRYFMPDKYVQSIMEEDKMKRKDVEINENTVFSCLTAQKACEFLGKTGQFSNSMDKPTFISGKLTGIKMDLRENMFISEGEHAWRYFAPDVEPTYRDFNAEDLNDLVGKIIIEKCTGNKVLITGRAQSKRDESIALSGDHPFCVSSLFQQYTMEDGSPCGMLS